MRHERSTRPDLRRYHRTHVTAEGVGRKGEDAAAKAEAVVAKLHGMAMRGNVAAAGLFLDRVLGAVRPIGDWSDSTPPPATTRVNTDRRVSPEARGPEAPERPRTMLSVAEVADELGLSTATVPSLPREEGENPDLSNRQAGAGSSR